ncbi:Diphthamide biosynthesis protein 4 [Podila epigama]|nr:Diphthamide biosynthesis protein 4 [Podila epigama]
MLKDYYAILGVAENASPSEIKMQYQKLLLIHHPDKQRQAGQTAPQDSDQLQDIMEAWECLRIPSQREFYDSSLKAMKLRTNGQVNDDIDLDDMDYDDETSVYTSPCRCSGEYAISEKELELGVDTVVCSTCSLIVRIHYEVADDDDDDDNGGN